MKYILNKEIYMNYEFTFNLFIVHPEERCISYQSDNFMRCFFELLQEIKTNKEIIIKRINVTNESYLSIGIYNQIVDISTELRDKIYYNGNPFKTYRAVTFNYLRKY